TGREALEQIKQAVDMNSPFAAVIIDGALPDMDGMKVVERIRAEVPTESPATIMTTSGEWPPDEGRSRAAGISAILGKPVRQPALQEALTAVILNKTKAVDTRREESHHEAVAPVPAEAAESGGEATANEPSEEKSEPAGEHAPKQMIESVGTEFPVQKVESTGEESPAEKDETAGDDMSEHKVESAGEELPEQKVESASAEQPEQKVESIVQESSRDNIETAGNDMPEHKIESAGEEPPEQEVESVSAELPAQKVESIGEESPAKSDETAGEVASEQKAESAGQELPIQKVESASEDRSEQKVESADKESHVQKVNSAPEDSSGEATASAPDESPGESAPATKDNAQTPRKLVAKQVLLFDAGDDARRAITAKLLHKHGLEVSTVKTGQEVLEKLVSGKYDIAFFDPVMPGPDGVDVANKFRHSKRINGSRVPLVVIIPEDGKLNRKAFRDAGIDDFLEQPIELTRMIELIETHCGAKQTAGKTKAEQAQPLMRFDREKALAMVNGDSEMLTDVIEIFEDVCESCLAALDASLKSSDYGKVIDLAGKIRKAASDVGAMKISRMGEQLSTLSLPDSLDIAQEISETLRQEFAEFRKIAAMFARSTMA
ncbi:MAG: response regulator, partial [Candidatus Thorarchaeota archaeon]